MSADHDNCPGRMRCAAACNLQKLARRLTCRSPDGDLGDTVIQRVWLTFQSLFHDDSRKSRRNSFNVDIGRIPNMLHRMNDGLHGLKRSNPLAVSDLCLILNL